MTKKSNVEAVVLLAAASFAAGVAPAQTPVPTEEVVVTGRRLSEASAAIGTDAHTATVSITREALLSAPAGITGLKILESLPGFNVQANDALGMYEFGNSVSVRAFTFRQIGFLVDGLPLGRSDQFGGSPIYRYVDNENLARVTASAGSGDVSLPSYASLGPIVNYLTLTPATEFELGASQTFGSDSLSRTLVRVETGEIGNFAGYLSWSTFKSDLWRGAGTIDREHLEGKLRYGFANGGALTFQLAGTDYFDYDAPSISVSQYRGTANDPFGRSGRYFAYLDYVPTLPETVPGVPFSNALYNQYYKQALNSRDDKLYGLTLDTPFGDGAVQWTNALYYEDKDGYGVSPEAYATSLGSYNAQRTIVPGLTPPAGLQYGLSTIGGDRRGFTSSLSFTAGRHALSAAAWVEQDRYHRTQARYNQIGGHPDGEPQLDEPVHLQRDHWSTRDSLQISFKDVISLLDDRLQLELGAKALDLDYVIDGYRNPADYINSRRPRITDNWQDNFLPQVGLVYDLNGRDQLFTSYSETLALPQGADDIYAAASPAAPGPEAETARNFEVGVRFNRTTFNAALVAYLTTFDNRLQSYASVVPGTTTTETFFQNVGGVKAHGLELIGQWKPEGIGDWVYFNTNASYNVATFEDGYSTFDIAGNALPDHPELVFQGGVTFDFRESVLLNVSARYIGPRYSNYVNTEERSGYTVVNAYLDVGEGFSAGPLKEAKLRLNVDNLFDRDYLGTINVTTNTPATFRPGPPRTVQLTFIAAL